MIGYPYIWLKEHETKSSVDDMGLSETIYLNESYIKIDKRMTMVDSAIRNMVNTYKAIFNPTAEEVRKYRDRLLAHVKQFL